MLRLKDTRHPNTAAFLNSAIRVAEYYGFAPLEDTARTSRNAHAEEFRRQLPKKDDSEILFARREERPLAVGARRCAIRARGTGKTMLAWRTSGNTTKERSGMPTLTLELHIVGNASAIAEVLLIVV